MTPRKDKEEDQKQDNPETAHETPFQRFERLAKKVVSVPKRDKQRQE